MTIPHQDHIQAEEKRPLWKRMRKPAGETGKKLFWVWIGYQTVKGLLTTSLIWIPLIYAMLKS